MAGPNDIAGSDGGGSGSRPYRRLKAVVERRDTRAGRIFDAGIQGLIAANLIAFSLDTLPGLAPWLRRLLGDFEVFSIAVFTSEYLLRLVVADHRMRYIFSFLGLIDLAAVLPFYLATGGDLRALRAVRLLRLLKLFRYGPAIDRFRRAFHHAKDELVLFASVAAVLLFLSASGIWYFENEAQPEVFKSVFHALWWSVVTLTTVGYGDAYPVTTGGRIFTAFILIVGLGVVAIPTGLIASALSQARSEEK
ncbi:MAG: hypothetical protein Kow00104_00340 [Rhodothalassiaceae bacterium]